MTTRFALRRAYDGTAFAGWWRQPDQRTVAGELDAALARLGEGVSVGHEGPVGASRTDAGVHARGQVAHADLQRAWNPGDLQRILNRQLPDDLTCTAIAPVADDFHATQSSTGKTYRYLCDPQGDPWRARFAWRLPFAVDLAALQSLSTETAASTTAAGFARRGEFRDDLTIRLSAVRWYHHRGLLVCRITGDRFTYRLVRSLVGGMLAVARGAARPADWTATLAGEVTPAGREQAPAHGLHLARVHYPVDPFTPPG